MMRGVKRDEMKTRVGHRTRMISQYHLTLDLRLVILSSSEGNSSPAYMAIMKWNMADTRFR